MKIDKAIRRLGGYIKYRKPDPDDCLHEAVQLGIEALIARKRCRQLGVISYVGDGSVNRAIPRCQVPLLPGETES